MNMLTFSRIADYYHSRYPRNERMGADMLTATDPNVWTVVNALTTRGAPIVLASDPEGDYFLSEQYAFRGGETLIVAHRIGPGDKLRDGITRFAVLK